MTEHARPLSFRVRWLAGAGMATILVVSLSGCEGKISRA